MDDNLNINNTTNDADDALKSFLERDTSDVVKAPKQRKLNQSTLWIIIGCVAVLLIVGLVILLNTLPNNTDSEIDNGTQVELSVDDNNVHQAQLVLNHKGELDNNSYGTLISYTPAQIKQIDVENESGTYTIEAETPTEKDEETGEETQGSTVYTLVGFENIDLMSGGADTIADDVAAIDFLSVADITGENSADFGFGKPRAVVKTEFTDGTYSTVTVGDAAASQLGTYIMFGDSKTVYLVANDSADGFLYSILNLISLTVNDAATDTDNSEFETLTLSGEAFDSDIEIRPNEDSSIDSTYVMIKPSKMFVSEVEAANIAGAIRGLYADEAVCVNPSKSQLKEYGLSTPYAKLTAVYPDTTVHLSASKPKDDSVYLIADSDIVYKLTVTALPWVETSYSKLVPDVVIDPNFNSISRIVVTDESGKYNFDVTTVTETVPSEDGGGQEVQNTTAIYKGEQLDADNFHVFYQNIANMQNAGTTDSEVSGKPVLTIEISYSTDREKDRVCVYPTGNTKYIATLNGDTLCGVYKSYCTKFSSCVQDLINGETVSSF